MLFIERKGMMIHTLEEHQGKLYIVTIDNDYNEPVRRHSYFPTGASAEMYPHDIGERLRRHAPGLYKIEARIDSPIYGMTNRGDTVPEFTKDEPLPAPNTRVETRYTRGHWEKLLKSKGWVFA